MTNHGSVVICECNLTLQACYLIMLSGFCLLIPEYTGSFWCFCGAIKGPIYAIVLGYRRWGGCRHPAASPALDLHKDDAKSSPDLTADVTLQA
mmetsp:Transcript_59700/g.106139  ORF Transcript_59700/g.106139 Transcript_59700/m.106139 type:complete len:93 (+) Transcript_59700:503-781(+)